LNERDDERNESVDEMTEDVEGGEKNNNMPKEEEA